MVYREPHHHVLVSLAVAATVQSSALVWSSRQSARIIEAASGATAALTAASTYAARGTFFARQTLATVLMIAWGVRLSAYLYRRDLVSPVSPRSLCITRTLWATVVAAPVVAVNALQAEPEQFDASEAVGLALAVIGLALEATADAQKEAWHAAHLAARPGRTSSEPPCCASGTWAWSRHPNLAGEVAFQAGLYLIVWRAVPVVAAAAPLITLYLVAWLRAGPLWSLEREKAAQYLSFPAYHRYRAATSPLLPMPPRVYAALVRLGPNTCETLCCEPDIV